MSKWKPAGVLTLEDTGHTFTLLCLWKTLAFRPLHTHKLEQKNGSRNNNQKEALREHVGEFKEVFTKENDPSSSRVVLEEQYFDASNERSKSSIVCVSSYLN